MKQQLLFDTRVAVLKEDEDCGYDVLNSDEITTEDSSNLIHSGMSENREDFENDVKKSYGVKKVRWVN